MEFNLDALDVDAAEAAVQQQLDAEAAKESIADDSDGCEGGACKI